MFYIGEGVGELGSLGRAGGRLSLRGRDLHTQDARKAIQLRGKELRRRRDQLLRRINRSYFVRALLTAGGDGEQRDQFTKAYSLTHSLVTTNGAAACYAYPYPPTASACARGNGRGIVVCK